MKSLWIRCKVYPGQFSNEYAVKATQSGGGEFSLFAPLRSVQTDETPTRDSPVDGWLEVTLYDRKDNTVVVRLPRESFESGRYVTVDLAQFREMPEAAKV